MSWLAIFAATYVAVFIAEIVGDKLLYTTGVLATRYRSLPIIFGMALAFMVKMGAAVMGGAGDRAAAQARHRGADSRELHRRDLGAVAQVRRPARGARNEVAIRGPARSPHVRHDPALEWADVGMITAATMAANNPHSLFIVWLGAVSAMVTKGLIAAFLGAGLRQWIRNRIQPRHLRYASVVALAILGAAAVAEDMGWIDEGIDPATITGARSASSSASGWSAYSRT
jgi:putative Ca2+/H+ antiporter (TMEM165/GDT1 family)